MSDEPRRYRSYLLRMWQEPLPRPCAWRASLLDSQTGELQGFADIAQLFAFLEQQIAEPETSARTRRMADGSATAQARVGESRSAQKGVALPATEQVGAPPTDSPQTTGGPRADE
jgi:hypothetical protein